MVVNFDKLNEVFANEKKVPIIGELMVSRWAYEAIVTTQFKDNPHNAKFYELDRQVAQNTFMSLYYIKYLQDNLHFCKAHPDHPQVGQKLELIRNELEKELDVFGADKFPNVEKLNKEQFSGEVFEEAKEFLTTAQRGYNNRRQAAKAKINEKIAELTSTEAKEAVFYKMKSMYENDRINYILKSAVN